MSLCGLGSATPAASLSFISAPSEKRLPARGASGADEVLLRLREIRP